MKKKILVTGAAGFMGSHIVDALLEAGHEVYGIDNLSGGFRRNINPRCKFTLLDLSNTNKTHRYIEKNPPEILYHLAANAREGASFFDPANITRNNYLAYMNTLEPCIKYGLKKVILFSSMAVYGEQKTPFSEDMPRQPCDIYGINKAAMEHSTEILAECHGFSWVILRPHNVSGPRQSLRDRYRNFIAITMNHIMRGEPIIIYGDGEQCRAFSYIKDSLPCYVGCLDDDIDREIINIGGKSPLSINYMVALIAQAFLTGGALGIKNLPPRHGEVRFAWCTTEKSERLLGYKETKTLWEWIQEMAEWVRGIGPVEWNKHDVLPLMNEKVPETWREKK